MVTIKEKRKEIIAGGAGGGIALIILTILFSTSGQPDIVYGIKFYFPDYATCDLVDCFIEGNISHNFTQEICFSKQRIRGKFPRFAKAISVNYWGNVQDFLPTYGWVEKSYTCYNDFSYNLDEAWCWYVDGNGTNITLFYVYNWTHGNLQTKTIYWDEWDVNGSEAVVHPDWKELPQEICMQPNTNYTLKLTFKKKPWSSGKFNITAGLPDSMGGTNFTLDPWLNTTFESRLEINVTTTKNATNYTIGLNLDLSSQYSKGEIIENCTNIRVGNDTYRYEYHIENCSLSVSDIATIWVKVPQINSSINNTFYIYYNNNTEVPDNQSSQNTHIVWDSWEDQEYANNPTWTLESASGSYGFASDAAWHETYARRVIGTSTTARMYLSTSLPSTPQNLYAIRYLRYNGGCGETDKRMSGMFAFVNTTHQWGNSGLYCSDTGVAPTLVYFNETYEAHGLSWDYAWCPQWWKQEVFLNFENNTFTTKVWRWPEGTLMVNHSISLNGVLREDITLLRTSVYARQASGGSNYVHGDRVQADQWIYPEPTYATGAEESYIAPSEQTCQVLSTANQYYQMTASITDHAASCFNITADNVTLDCAGYMINGTSPGSGTASGVNATSAINVTVANCTIQKFVYGVATLNTNHSTITNNSISDTDTPILLTSSKDNSIINNSASSSSVASIFLYYHSHDNTISSDKYNKIIWLLESCNNTFVNTSSSTYVLVQTSSVNNTFLNCSYSSEAVVSNSELIRQWYVRANVTKSADGNPTSANVTFENRTGDKIGDNETSNLATGLTPWVTLIEYKNIAGVVLRHTNYTVNAFKALYEPNSTSFNFTNNKQVNLTIHIDTDPPVVSWGAWVGKNDTTVANSTTVTWSTDEIVQNCTLYINYSAGFYHNTTQGSSFSQNLTNLPNGNYTLNVTCRDLNGFRGNSTDAWWDVYNVDTSPPTYSDNSTNSTEAGRHVSHNLKWQDNQELDGYIFSFCNGSYSESGVLRRFTTESTDLLEDSYTYNPYCQFIKFDMSEVTSRPIKANLSIYRVSPYTVTDPTLNITRITEDWTEDFSGLELAALAVAGEFNASYSTTTAMWQNISINVSLQDCWDNNQIENCSLRIAPGNCECGTVKGSASRFKLGDADCDEGRHEYYDRTHDTLYWRIYIDYGTGSCDEGWINDTFVSMSGATDWSNVTKKISEDVGDVIAWKVYANDTSGNLNESEVFTYTTTTPDYDPPVITWDWIDINSTTNYNSTTIGVSLNELGNCTLHFNGTDYVNDTLGTSITWNISNIPNGNYSSINVTCHDDSNNKGDSTDAWWNVSFTVIPPWFILDWDWEYLDTISVLNSTTICGEGNRYMENCTLHRNDSLEWTNTTGGATICFNQTNMQHKSWEYNITCITTNGTNATLNGTWTIQDFCANPMSLTSDVNCTVKNATLYNITADAVNINFSKAMSGLSDYFWVVIPTTASQTLNVTLSDRTLSIGYNITLNLTRTGNVGNLSARMPLSGENCSYDTDTNLSFKITDYANCRLLILEPTSNHEVIRLWTSPKWGVDNLTPIILAVLAAGGAASLYMIHRKTKRS